MAAKRLILVALTAALVSACGGSNTSPTAATASTDPTLGATDTTGLDSTVGGDPGGALTDYGASSPYGVPTSPAASASASPAASLGSGFTLKGLVTDAIGKPLAGAKVSIGSQTKLSGADGTFELDGIMDTQVDVAVTLDGYQPIPDYTVTFTTDAPTADKEFKLAPNGTATTTDGSSGTGGATSGTGSPPPTNGFTLQSTFNPGNFKSVSSMTVDGDVCYVLGIVKGLLLSHNTVVELNAATGEQIRSFNKVGFLSYIPKDANSIVVLDGQVKVANGSTTYWFNADGSLAKKTSGGAVAVTSRIANDPTRGLGYKLVSGSKIEVSGSSGTTQFSLPGALQALAIGVDTNGDVLVLDGSQSAVLQYTFQP